MKMRRRMMMREMCALWVTWLCASAAAQYSSDQCNWRGSGLSHESHALEVEQVYLRCSEGSLEWLYPTGAIIVNLRPNTTPQRATDERITACVKPRGGGSSGSNLYVERGGAMRLLLDEEAQLSGGVRCFNLEEGALFIQASTHTDISRRVTAFQYQLIRRSTATPHNFTDACRPCTNDDIIMAVCTSDFVVRGSVRSVGGVGEDQATLLVSVSHVFRQKHRVFRSHGRRRPSGRIQVPSSCGIRAGQWAGLGDYLFTGAMRFGEAWLGCALRYKDFLQLYQEAELSGRNPCHIDLAKPQTEH